jgi:hypothetical protein
MFFLALVHVAGQSPDARGRRSGERAGCSRRANISLWQDVGVRPGVVHDRRGRLPAIAQVGVSRAINFQTQDSLTLAATSLIGGIFGIWGALIAGIFNQLLPASSSRPSGAST